MDRGLAWFKHGIQYDAKCNAVDWNGKPAKRAITVFAEDRSDAIDLVIKELQKYGYANVTIDRIARVG